jgi:hypothetical protein
MNIIEILEGAVPQTSFSVEEQTEVLDQMKAKLMFDLTEKERLNLIDFLCEKVDPELTVDYLFHVLDNEISYPVDDEKAKSLFSDERMMKMKTLMMNKLEDDSEPAEITEEN